MRTVFFLVSTGALILAIAATPVAAAPSPSALCASTKWKGAGQQAKAQSSCEARAIASSKPLDPNCPAKAREKTTRAYLRAETKGGCLVTGDAAAAVVAIDDLVGDLVAQLPFADTTAARKCAAAKLRAGGTAAQKRLACFAIAQIKTAPVDPACLSKASTALTKAVERAERPGGCSATGDAAAIQAIVDAATDALVQASGPTCGDGVAESLEECDDGNTASGDGCDATCQLESAAALCAGVPSTPGTALASVLITGALNAPVGLYAAPLDPNRLFVVEKGGRIRIVKDGELLAAPFLDVHTLVSGGSEQGLLGMAFHPDFDSNRRFFVNYTNTAGDTVIARYEASPGNPDDADESSARILLTIDQPYANHNGGELQFGPDGYLYAGLGDGGWFGDPGENAQDDGKILGKMLRLDVDVETAPYYAVPATNPNPGAGAPLGLIWAKGLRNPWRFSFDRATGDLVIADVGQNAFEEIDFQPAASTGGENYGWDVFEANACYEPAPDPVCPTPPAGFTFPILSYSHGEGCSISGGYVYRGCAMPDLAGTYFYGDYCSAFIRTFEMNAGSPSNPLDRTAELDPPGAPSIGLITSFGEDARGELYVVDQGGELFKIVPGN